MPLRRKPSVRTRNMLVVTGGFPSVSQTFVLREISAARALGWNVHVLSPCPGTPSDWEQGRQFGVADDSVLFLDWRKCSAMPNWGDSSLARAVDKSTYGRSLAWRRGAFFKRLLRHEIVRDADLIHCHFVQWAAEVGVGLAGLLDVPLTVEAHDSHLLNHSPAVLSRVQRAASSVGCVSRAWVDAWEVKTGSGEGLLWLPNGVEISEFDEKQHEHSAAPIILSVSNCVEHKRPDDLIRAAALLKARGLDFQVIIVGDGPFAGRLREIVRELDVQDRCTLVGSQSHLQVRRWLHSSDIFALCSERESFGIVTVEAMASGLPTVVSRTAGSRDIVTDGETGYTFEVGDIESLANHLAHLLGKWELRKHLGCLGRQRAAALFSWDRHMDLVAKMWDRSFAM